MGATVTDMKIDYLDIICKILYGVGFCIFAWIILNIVWMFQMLQEITKH